MITSKQFFEELREREEYLTILASKEVYNGIEFELKERMVVNTVRQKNSLFIDDVNHKHLLKNYNQAKAELRNYEFLINHK